MHKVIIYQHNNQVFGHNYFCKVKKYKSSYKCISYNQEIIKSPCVKKGM